MLHITFEYQDKYTNGQWRSQSCVMPSVAECIEFYGLGKDCNYRFTKVVNIDTKATSSEQKHNSNI